MKLVDIITNCRSGYARDLADSILDPLPENEYNIQDADSLFRTLVLDENWSVQDAEDAYEEALMLLTQ